MTDYLRDATADQRFWLVSHEVLAEPLAALEEDATRWCFPDPTRGDLTADVYDNRRDDAWKTE